MKNTAYLITGSIILALSGCSISSDSTNDTGSGTTATTTTDTSPTITLIGSSNMQVTINGTFDDPGATAYDDEDGNLTTSIVTSSTVDTSVAGSYVISYSVTDSADTTTTAERTVTVAEAGADYYVDWIDQFSLPDQDDDGWSILTPSDDSRIMYVSSSDGDDDTAVAYDLSDSDDATTIGDDPYQPSGTIYPYATLAAAVAQMRDGYPDYVLLKRGDSWDLSSTVYMPYGRSADERAVFGAYGDETELRPEVKNNGLAFKDSGYLAIVSVHFNNDQANPSSDDFVGFSSVKNYAGFSGALEVDYGTILIEDCWFDWFSVNAIQSYTYDDDGNLINIGNIVIRRNIFTNSYSILSHSQGLYSSYTSVLLEENIFDHNGWYQQGDAHTKTGGQATMFNHNTYFTKSRNTIFRKNLFLRASSMGNKFTSNSTDSNSINAWNILIDNNFYAEGEIGISIGGNDDYDDGPRWQNIIVVNNVLTAIGRTMPTNRGLGWGLELKDWEGGLVQNNLLFDWGQDDGEDDDYTNTWAIKSNGHMTDTLFDNNIVYGLVSGTSVVAFTDEGTTDFVENAHDAITFTNNEISLLQDTGTLGRVIGYDIQPETFSFAGNYYYFNSDDDDWFITSENYSWSVISDYSSVTFNQFESIIDDNTSVQQLRDYTDPDRSIGGYLEDQGYATGLDEDTEMDAFVDLLMAQRKGNWDENLSAAALNDYFRAGFCVAGDSDC